MLNDELKEIDRRILLKKQHIKLIKQEIEELENNKEDAKIRRKKENHNYLWGTNYDCNV